MSLYPTYRIEHLVRLARRGEKKSLINAYVASPELFTPENLNKIFVASMNKRASSVYNWILPQVSKLDKETLSKAMMFSSSQDIEVLLKKGWTLSKNDYSYDGCSTRHLLDCVSKHVEGWERGAENLLVAYQSGLPYADKIEHEDVFSSIASLSKQKWKMLSNQETNIGDFLLAKGIPFRQGVINYDHPLSITTNYSSRKPDLLVSFLRYYHGVFTPAFLETNLNVIRDSLPRFKNQKLEYSEKMYLDWALMLYQKSPSIKHDTIKEKLTELIVNGLPEGCISIFERQELLQNTATVSRSARLRRI